VLWFTLWFMVIVKIPILYLAYVIWWAVKDPPDAAPGTSADEVDGGGPYRRPSDDRRRLRRGPHGSASRRSSPARLGRTRAPAGRR
jgi:hypothetical protein